MEAPQEVRAKERHDHMEYLVTAEEMKQYDSNTIEKLGIPGMVLMERAALEAFRAIEARFAGLPLNKKRVFILAGVGNNGGDGLALARLLCEAGYRVWIKCVGDEAKASAQWRRQRSILVHYPVFFCENDQASDIEYTILVDALFGVGLSRPVEGDYAREIEDFNNRSGFKVALDIPSGIHSDIGMVLGCAVSADLTVTFGFVKRGLVLYPGVTYAGEVQKAEIGISEKSFFGQMPGMFYYNEEPVSLLPKRDPAGNKGTFGKVLLVAGSMKMAGAAVLAAKAVYRTGAGMVKVISAPENREILQTTVPEALYGTCEDLTAGIAWADVIVIGPGIGTGQDALENLTAVIAEGRKPLVVDADGLNLLAKDGKMVEELASQGAAGRTIIVTPHVGELSRLLSRGIPELKKDLAGFAKALAKERHFIVAAKDARTFIAGEEGPICVNLRGNSGMATAGSGDVLAGIIGGLLAQGLNGFEAASVGAALHGAAGDRVAAIWGEHGCMAGDLPMQVDSLA